MINLRETHDEALLKNNGDQSGNECLIIAFVRAMRHCRKFHDNRGYLRLKEFFYIMRIGDNDYTSIHFDKINFFEKSFLRDVRKGVMRISVNDRHIGERFYHLADKNGTILMSKIYEFLRI